MLQKKKEEKWANTFKHYIYIYRAQKAKQKKKSSLVLYSQRKNSLRKFMFPWDRQYSGISWKIWALENLDIQRWRKGLKLLCLNLFQHILIIQNTYKHICYVHDIIIVYPTCVMCIPLFLPLVHSSLMNICCCRYMKCYSKKIERYIFLIIKVC